MLLGKGQLSLALSTTATQVRVVHESHCPEIGPICDQRPEPPQLHDQLFSLLDTRLVGEYGLTDRLGVALELPFKVNRTRIEYQHLDGTPFMPDYPNIHHRNETLVGLGDAWLLGRIALAFAEFAFIGKAGLSLPLGSTEENPFELGERGLEHQHVQFGTGTVDPVVIAEVTRRLGTRFAVGAHAQAKLVLYENEHGYRAGDRYGVGLQGRASITPDLALSVTTDVVGERPERWGGEILQDGNLGRTDVLLGVAATYRWGATLFALGVRVPIYQRIVQAGDEAAQLSYPAIVDLSAHLTFGLLGE